MLLTKECDYSVRIIRALRDGNKKTVKDISELEHIPYQYAYKILKKLQKAGFLQNKRGPSGGYVLVKALDSFTIYDVVGAIDKNLFLNECLRDETQCPNNKNAQCTVHKELIRLQDMLVLEMKNKTMEEIL